MLNSALGNINLPSSVAEKCFLNEAQIYDDYSILQLDIHSSS